MFCFVPDPLVRHRRVTVAGTRVISVPVPTVHGVEEHADVERVRHPSTMSCTRHTLVE